MWSHCQETHGDRIKGMTRADLTRGMFRPNTPTKPASTKRKAEDEGKSSPKRSRATSYSKELGPVPEFSLEVADSNNNRRVREKTPEREEQPAVEEGSPQPPPASRHQETSPAEDQEEAPAPDREETTTTRSTQTSSQSDCFGWDHHHTIVKEIRKNGTVVTTEDYIWRVGRGSVKFPCCESAAENQGDPSE